MSVHGSTPSRATRDADQPRRPRAFIPGPGDESHGMDTLGFFAWGAYRGEWSGTSAWLADAPLPEDVPEGLVCDLPAPDLIVRAREVATTGKGQAAVFLAPVVNLYGEVVLPIEGAPYDANPNFVAHVERTRPGGHWLFAEGVATSKAMVGLPTLVYVVDGLAHGAVAPSIP